MNGAFTYAASKSGGGEYVRDNAQHDMRMSKDI